MATTMNIPYYATDLRSRLPTESEVDKSSDISLLVKVQVYVPLVSMRFIQNRILERYTSSWNKLLASEPLSSWSHLNPLGEESITNTLHPYFTKLRNRRAIMMFM